MKENFDVKNTIINTIREEADAIKKLIDYVDQSFVDTVDVIYNSAGRVVVTGIGKSADIAKKIVSTFNSTGTPALFMHAAEAIHGDLGMLQKNDILLCLSKSGNTPEIKILIPLVKAMGNIIVAITGNADSCLANNADYVLSCFVDKEADPNNLAPTTSTTAQLVIGDALAVAVLSKRGFTSEDFAKYHPGGSLGKRLYLRVEDLYKNNEKPEVSEDSLLSDALIEISSKRLGCTAVVKDGNITGIITDGDLRRFLGNEETGIVDVSISVQSIMTKNPKTIEYDAYAAEALEIMRNNQITQLLVLDKYGKYAGVIHIHDLIQEGII